MAKFKEVNRLSIAIGLLSSLAVFCWGFWEMFIMQVYILIVFTAPSISYLSQGYC